MNNDRSTDRPKDRITVALAGQPNVGKSTVFNLLTGLSQHVGNWPGKTIEQKSGVYHHHCQGHRVEMKIVDLPGTYSLTANSLEERIARDYLIKERPDVAVVMADAAALERSLYLLAELLYLPVPIVLGLNMMDTAEQQGIHIEPHVLKAALGLPVVPMVATRNRGIRELVQAVEQLTQQAATFAPNRPEIREDHCAILVEIQHLIANQVPQPYPENWVALKLLEGDEEITRMMQAQLSDRWENVHVILRRHEDAIVAVAGGRYDWIGRMVRAAVTRPKAGPIVLTDRVDRVATHPLWGLLLLLGVLGIVLWLTYSIGAPLQEILKNYLVRAGADWVRGALAGAPWWLTGMVTDGLIGGAGMVVTFLPILVIFFAAFGLLEDVGYLARAAYVMDRYMHWMGLHGKSFLPLCLGFGCNVPAVLSTRIIDSPKARLLTILVAPLIPCTARLAAVTVLAPIFFGAAAPWILWGLVGLNVVILAIMGFTLHKLVLDGEHVAFIMELPLYHLPNAHTISVSVWQRTLSFLKKAGSIILVVSVVVWAFSVLPERNLETSYLASAGHWLSPIGAWMGLNWQMMVALLTSFVAKENTIATLGILYRVSEANWSNVVAGVLTPAAALAFLAVQMLFIPCAATVAAIRQETRSWKWTTLSVGLLLVISLATGVLIYQMGRWL
jgi:ferrous iron transport protein B